METKVVIFAIIVGKIQKIMILVFIIIFFAMIHLVLIYFITFINIPCFIKRNIYNIMKKIMILYLFVDKQNIH